MHRVITVVLLLATPMICGAADSSDMPFAEQEARILELLDLTPRDTGHVVEALQHLHGDVDVAFLVRRYVSDRSIDENLRGTLLNMLHVEVLESAQMDAETTAAIADFARSTDSYYHVSTVSQMLEASGTTVPWSIRIRQSEFQWRVLSWMGLPSLAVGFATGLYVLVLVALPGRKSRLSSKQRAVGFGLWLLLSALFISAVLASLLHSIGHNWMPRPDKALPFYVATLVVASFLAMLAISLRRRRAPQSTDVATDST